MSSLIKIAWAPIYAHPLPEGHRFPMLKYELIPGQLLHEGTITEENIFAPAICPDEIVLMTHDAGYLKKLKEQELSPREQRVIGFPQSPELTQRELIITQGTIDCCRFAFESGVALNVAGGTHHAFADRGEGFCMLNDFAVAANYLLHHKMAERILIIDLDVHQGNGTANLFHGRENVFTFSMHGRHNYPFRKEISTLDLPLEDGTTGKEYLDSLDSTLSLIDQRYVADFVFYLSGVDVLNTDKFGRLKLSIDDCRERDRKVFDWVRSKNLPCVVAMGGGYSEDVKIITEAHCNTFRLAKETWQLL